MDTASPKPLPLTNEQREKQLLSLMVEWDLAQSDGKDLSPSELCPDNLDIQQELYKRIARQKMLIVETVSNKMDSTSEMDILPEIPGYTITKEINRGGMGVVYAGRDTRLNREVAIKTLLPRYSPKSEMAKRFEQEAKIAAQLQHPGIMPVHELGFTKEGRPYLAMKWIKGKTLQEILTNEKPEWPQLRFIFEQVCRTMAYAHSKRIIHRDLKPSNVMVGAFGEIQVMDWGLAKSIDDMEIESNPEDLAANDIRRSAVVTDRDPEHATRTGSILGTLAFMPPEQAKGELNKTDTRADVFALGGILCVILTGHPVYTGTTEQIRKDAIAGNLKNCFARLDRAITQGADSELVAIVKRCLAISPKDRPRTAGVLDKMLSHLYGSSPTMKDNSGEHSPIPPWDQTPKATPQTRRKRMILRFTIEILICVVLGLALAALFLHNNRASSNQANKIENMENKSPER